MLFVRAVLGAEPRARRGWLAAACLLVASCGGSRTSITPVSENASGLVNTTSAPRIPGMPALPFAVAQSSAPFQRLYEGVQEALEDAMPEPTVSSEAAYRRWIEHDLASWMERRGTAIRAAENRARSLVNSPDDEKGVGHALAAFLNERTAEDVIEAPVPNESTRPERAAALHAAWRDQLHGLLSAAHAHWVVCARTLELASPEVAAWKSRCDDEAESSEGDAVEGEESSEPAPEGGDAP